MYLYTVVFQPHRETEVWVNYFWADSTEHAREQAEDAEPDNVVLGVFSVPESIRRAKEIYSNG